MDWDDADVRAVLQLVDAAGFDELEIETDRFSLSLRRGGDGALWTRESRTLTAARELQLAPDAATTPSASVSVDVERPADEGMPSAGTSHLRAVTTPLPGTFYRSPKPGAPPFVEVGTRVTPDTVVAIVETMKLMNSVYAGSNGRIVAFAIGDGTFVAQSSVLMQIEPDLMQIEPGGAAEDA
jgi:acetyl-CoA carboxylase biotin carboxyl carrier protein